MLVSRGIATGQTYNVLHSFNGSDGAGPISLVFDSYGNLYESAGGGISGCGNAGCGVIFRLSPSNGGWVETVVFAFCSDTGCPGGFTLNAGLVIDKAGSLYGTAQGGALGGGLVFQISGGTETVLYNFCAQTNCADGAGPQSGLAIDASGNLYGTTWGGGTCKISSSGCGVVFELSPPSTQGAAWTETILYNFCSVNTDCPDGAHPVYGGNLAIDKSGSLYGMTQYGGNSATCCGTIYKVSPTVNGWNYSVLYAPSQNAATRGPLSLDSADNIYGAFEENSLYKNGGVFRLDARGQVSDFGFVSLADGAGPETGVVVDDNNPALYGVTLYGGIEYGTVFEVVGRPRREIVLHNFCSQTGCADGQSPYALIENQSGQLFGTTVNGGIACSVYPDGCGVVFELTP